MEIHFLRPYWFIMLIPMGIIWWRLTKITVVDNWRFVCDAHLLPHLLVKPERSINSPFFLLLIGSLLAIFALAGPSWEKQAQPIYRSMAGNILVLNLSPSMADSVGPTKKIDRARFKMLDYLKRQKEGLTGLVIYTDEAHTISPLTEDSNTVANFVPSLDPNIMPTFNDDTEVGLRESEKLFKQAGISSGNIVLITDKITHFSSAKKLASSLFAEGYRLYVYDLSQSSEMNSEMRELAGAGGGEVISIAPNNRDIDNLLAKTTPRTFIPPTKKTSEKGFFWQDNGRAIVFLLLPLALLAFRRGYL